MNGSLNRIFTMLMRYFYLHKRSLPRTLEIFFWPVMELLVWGFLTVYIQQNVKTSLSQMISFLINAMIFWDVLYRSQQGVTISFMEEIWHQNLINILVSPLQLWEWLTATFLYGMMKTIAITGVLGLIALVLYHFNLINELGFLILPLVFNLLLFGWALGTFTAGLLLRWGYAVEALIWGIPFLIQPFSAIFYPLSVLPESVQFFSLLLPSTYVFEGMRHALASHSLPINFVVKALLLNTAYFFVGALLFKKLFAKAKESGRLVKLGMD